MRKAKSDYKVIQMDAELHRYLKEYCQRHGFKMSGFIAALVRQAITNNKNKQYEEDLYNQIREHPGWSD